MVQNGCMSVSLISLHERLNLLRSRLAKVQAEEWTLLNAIVAAERAIAEVETESGVIPIRKSTRSRRLS